MTRGSFSLQSVGGNRLSFNFFPLSSLKQNVHDLLLSLLVFLLEQILFAVSVLFFNAFFSLFSLHLVNQKERLNKTIQRITPFKS